MPLNPVVVGNLDDRLAERVRGRHLGDVVDDSSGITLTVEHRCRSSRNLDALGAVGFEVVINVEPRVAQHEAVPKVRRGIGVEPAHAQTRKTWLDAEGFRRNARCVTQRFRQFAGIPGVQEVAGYDRYGLRRFDERGIGLGAGAVDVRYEILAENENFLDGSLRNRCARFCEFACHPQHEIVFVDNDEFDAGAFDHPLERIPGGHRAPHRRTVQFLNGSRVRPDLLAGDPIEIHQRLREGLFRNVELVRLLRSRLRDDNRRDNEDTNDGNIDCEPMQTRERSQQQNGPPWLSGKCKHFRTL